MKVSGAVRTLLLSRKIESRAAVSESQGAGELETIHGLYLQQKKMSMTGTHRMENRIAAYRRPSSGQSSPTGSAEDTGKEKKNDRNRIKVERFCSVGKRKYGSGLMMAGLSDTTPDNIARSILLANLFGPISALFFVLSCGQPGRRDFLYLIGGKETFRAIPMPASASRVSGESTCALSGNIAYRADPI